MTTQAESLRAALTNCGLAAHYGGQAMDSKRRGGREKLAYIERTAAEALALTPPAEGLDVARGLICGFWMGGDDVCVLSSGHLRAHLAQATVTLRDQVRLDVQMWREMYLTVATNYARLLEHYDLAEDAQAEDIIEAARDALAATPPAEGLDRKGEAHALVASIYAQIDLYRENEARRGKPVTPGWFVAVADIFAEALTPPAEGLTHGRHCPCSACEREDWTNPNLAHCGMHGPSCPPVYAPRATPPADTALDVPENLRVYYDRAAEGLDVERLAQAQRRLALPDAGSWEDALEEHRTHWRTVVAPLAREYATPPAEGLDRRLSDCEDALSTVEAAYDALAAAPPVTTLTADEVAALREVLAGLATIGRRGFEDDRRLCQITVQTWQDMLLRPAQRLQRVSVTRRIEP